MKVYVLSMEYYYEKLGIDEFDIIGVYSSKEKAEMVREEKIKMYDKEIINKINKISKDDFSIVEYTLDETF